MPCIIQLSTEILELCYFFGLFFSLFVLYVCNNSYTVMGGHHRWASAYPAACHHHIYFTLLSTMYISSLANKIVVAVVDCSYLTLILRYNNWQHAARIRQLAHHIRTHRFQQRRFSYTHFQNARPNYSQNTENNTTFRRVNVNLNRKQTSDLRHILSKM